MFMIIRFMTFLLLLSALPSLALAKMESVSDKQGSALKIERYLNALDTVQARFVQTAHDGTQMVGTFYLDRPGKLRFQYDPPLEDFVVADGVFIYFYDGELKEQTNAPIGQTLADFLLRPDIKLREDIRVENVKRGGGYLQIELSQTEDPNGGRLMLAFDESPFKLRKWRIIDPQGLITEVELFYMKTGMDLDSGLFNYIDPNRGESPNYNN